MMVERERDREMAERERSARKEHEREREMRARERDARDAREAKRTKVEQKMERPGMQTGLYRR